MERILILCNGSPPAESLLRECCAKADYFIAADGGGNIARSFGINPDVVIGDLDSFDKSGDEPFEVIFKADQETNDLEKALAHAQKMGSSQVEILGATGKRIDQTLKNLSVLKQFNPHFDKLLLKDDYGTTRLIPPSFETDLPVDTTVSLFPLSGRVNGITTQGLKYSLKNEALENGVRDGSSNKTIKSSIKITYDSGDLLLFVAHKPLS